MPSCQEITEYCNSVSDIHSINDYPGAYNGLQVENTGEIRKIGAAVDAGLVPFQMATEREIDYLIVHHGLFWGPIAPVTGINYQKLKSLFDHNIALYSNHLPLDRHPEIGNNALLAKAVGITTHGQFGDFEGVPVGCYSEDSPSREDLAERLRSQFQNVTAIEFGPAQPKRIGIMTGGGGSMILELPASGIDTLITGECSEHHFNMAQELGINLYLCGHYATEVFAVQALAEKVADHFGLSWEFLDTGNPL